MLGCSYKLTNLSLPPDTKVLQVQWQSSLHVCLHRIWHTITSFFFFILSIHWICYNIISVLYFGFFWPGVMWDLRSPTSPTRDRACKPCVGRQSLNHWTAKEAPTVFSWMNEWMKSVTEPRSFESSSAQFPKRRDYWKQRDDGNAKKEREA